MVGCYRCRWLNGVPSWGWLPGVLWNDQRLTQDAVDGAASSVAHADEGCVGRDRGPATNCGDSLTGLLQGREVLLPVHSHRVFSGLCQQSAEVSGVVLWTEDLARCRHIQTGGK